MPSPIPIADQIACVTRELAMLRHVYPGLVRQGAIPQTQWDYNVACMEAVLGTLEYLEQPGQVDLFAPRDETDGPWPCVIDLYPCADCDTPLLWTRLDDVRTAWQVHQCPPREEPTP